MSKRRVYGVKLVKVEGGYQISEPESVEQRYGRPVFPEYTDPEVFLTKAAAGAKIRELLMTSQRYGRFVDPLHARRAADRAARTGSC